MYSEPRMIVLTGLLFGAVTIGAYLSQRDNDWSSGRDASLAVDGGRSVRATTAAAGQTEGRPGAVAGAQATRRRALRDDVAALRGQTNESIGAQAGDALAIAALQLAQQTNPPPQTDTPQPTNTPQQTALTSNRTQAESAPKTGHAQHGRVAPHHEHARGESSATKKPRSAHYVATTSGTGHARGGSHRSSSTAERSAKKTASVVPEPRPFSRYATPGVDWTPPVPRAGLTTQVDTRASASNAPKTRAEVRAELERARENGTLPAFGNPEPTGPAGTLRP